MRNVVNDGSTNAPRLELQQSWWAMIGLGEDGREWSVEEKFSKIAEAGYKAISSGIPPLEEQEEWKTLLKQYDLQFNAIGFPTSVADMEEIIANAKQFGCVQYLNVQVMDGFVIDEEAIQLLSGIMDTVEKAGFPIFIETHRGTVTQDLLRVIAYVKAIPKLRLTIDLSHYVVAGELNNSLDKASLYFASLLNRTSAIHARVSNGEQVQIDIGPSGEHPMTKYFENWWGQAMDEWLEQAQPGDVLPFVTELGPPGYYAVTTQDKYGSEHEISDRWQQALLLKQIAERLWAERTV